MRPFFCLFQVIAGAAFHNFTLIINVVLQHFLQGEDFGSAVDQRQHNHPKGVLQLGKTIQLIEHHLGIGGCLQLNHNAHPFLAGIVCDVVDAFDPLILHQIHHGFDQVLLVDHIGDFGNHNAETVAVTFFNLGFTPQNHLASTGGIRRPNAGVTHNHPAGGEVGSLDVLAQLRKFRFGIVDEVAHGVHHLAQIVGRDVGCHTNRNPLGAVDQQTGNPRRQGKGFFQTVIVVGLKIHRFFVNIPQHFHSGFGQFCLGIPISSGRIAVNRTKVPLSVHHHIPQGEILCHTYQRIVHRCVPVGMVPPQHRTNRVGALAVCLFGVQVILIHSIQNAAVYRF